MKIMTKLAVLLVLSGMCLAAPAPSDADSPKKDAKAHKAKKVSTDERLRQLQELIEQQQAALQQVQQQLQQTQQQLQQTQQQSKQAQAEAQAVNTKVATVETNSNLQVQKVQADLSDVKTAVSTTAEAEKKTDKKVADLEHPNSISFRGIRLTPGGFLDLTGVYRTHTTNSGPATQFNAIPLEGSGQYGVGALSEFSMTARGSRITLRADADAGKTKLAGYFESDFYGNPIATPNQTTSYALRIRQAWGRAQWANGWSVTGGQMWNLMTMNRRAADSDAPWVPNTLDTNYLVGFEWGRQAELRIAKKFNKKYTFALALTDPAYLSSTNNTNFQVAGLASSGSGNLGNSVATTCTTTTASVTTCTLTDLYSTNLAPDTILKLAYDDPKYGHFELKAIQRFFRDRVPSTSSSNGWNNTAIGGGVGGGFIIPVLPKKLDIVAQGLYGKGISRYQDSGQYDFVVRTNTYSGTSTLTSSGGDNNLQTIMSFSGVLGLESHPMPKLELNLWGGTEYYGRSTYTVTAIPSGLKSLQGYGASNGANNRDIFEISADAWYDMVKGTFGTVRYGGQYEYIRRAMWSVGGASAPHGINSVVQLGFRYVLP